MDTENTIEVVDKDGWRNQYALPAKRFVQIGSDPKNDVVLATGRGTGVAPRHLQLIGLPGDEPAFRVVNLTDRGVAQVTPSAAAERQGLLPRTAVDIADGAQIRVGDFELRFHLAQAPATPLPVVAGPPRPVTAQVPELEAEPKPDRQALGGIPTAAPDIGLEISLSQTELQLDTPIEGTLTVRNQGSKPGVQFWLDLEGLGPENYEIGPGPILFPNAERQVFLRLHHPRQPDPPAGERAIAVRVTAPGAYPNQVAEASQTIRIAPFYSHEIRFVVDEPPEPASDEEEGQGL
jgi:hypothetical protein